MLQNRRSDQRTYRSGSSRLNGFSLTEALLAMLISALCISLLSMQAGTIRNSRRIHEDSQEQFAILQIRELVAVARGASIKDGTLELETEKGAEIVRFDRNRLVKTPGYEIFMEGIDSAIFSSEQEKIELIIQSHGKKKTWQIR